MDSQQINQSGSHIFFFAKNEIPSKYTNFFLFIFAKYHQNILIKYERNVPSTLFMRQTSN